MIMTTRMIMMKNMWKSDDNLALKKTLKLRNMIMVVRVDNGFYMKATNIACKCFKTIVCINYKC